MNDTSIKERKLAPPYIAFKTFTNFIEGLRGNVLPNRIDRSIMPNISGGYQKQLFNALEYLDLITDKGTVKPKLQELVHAKGETQVEKLKEILHSSYPFLFNDDFLKNATTKEIEEKFSQFGISGDTVRKCVMFFMNAAKHVKIELSPYIKPYKGLSRSTGSQKRSTAPSAPAGSGKSQYEEPQKDTTWNEMLLSKFPEFDPTWEPGIQLKWFDMFEKIMKIREKRSERDNGDDSNGFNAL